MIDWKEQVDLAKKASNSLKLLDTKTRNDALVAISKALRKNSDEILAANKIDLEKAVDLSVAMRKRLALTKELIESIADDVLKVKDLDDPINKVLEEYHRPNGLLIQKISVPLGLIGAIYESRPNVSIDIASLCLKTGNACLLKGGKEAFNTNSVVVNIMREAIKSYMDMNAITLINNNSREVVSELITMRGKIDLVIPRGGKGLINFVTQNARVPYIETGAGVCHIYVDDDADIEVALKIIENAKTSNPSVCNAVECVLVNEKIADQMLKAIKDLFENQVTLHGDEDVKKVISCCDVENYATEYDDFIMNLKIVKSLDEAINHIEKYGTHHSDAIISNNQENIEIFLNVIDSACVYANASTRFTDGGCFGFGAELGISTQKLHARGPMGLREMTTYKYKIYGSGQVR